MISILLFYCFFLTAQRKLQVARCIVCVCVCVSDGNKDHDAKLRILREEIRVLVTHAKVSQGKLLSLAQAAWLANPAGRLRQGDRLSGWRWSVGSLAHSVVPTPLPRLPLIFYVLLLSALLSPFFFYFFISFSISLSFFQFSSHAPSFLRPLARRQRRAKKKWPCKLPPRTMATLPPTPPRFLFPRRDAARLPSTTTSRCAAT